MNLASHAKITWCPGCPNSAIMVSFRKVVEEMCGDGSLEIKNIVAGSGVGCHGKIVDYLNINTFESLHGRIIPSLTGIKAGNPELTVVGFSGDGDSLSEGLSHLVHAAQKNTDISLFLHNNQTFALTTGQATGTSPKGFKGGSTPFGSVDEPIDPLFLMLASGATFIARTYAGDIEGTKKIMRKAIEHKGFSFVDIIQPCITFFDTRDYYKERMYQLPDWHNAGDLGSAFQAIQAAGNDKYPLGVFYNITKPTFEESI